jgi:FkbM family methyltransferase
MTTPPTATAPAPKRLLRSVWRALPRTRVTFNAGKLLTRTFLKPEPSSRTVHTLFAGRIPMDLDLGTFVANDLYCLDDHYESVTVRLWRSLARQSAVILDVGSHIGTFALLAADAHPDARVIAVEADTGIFALLRSHAAPYPNITPVHAAVADRETTMWFCPVGGNDGGGFLSPTRPGDPKATPVTTLTLQRLCATHGIGAIDLMKMDVEGFEHVLLTRDDAFFSAHAPRNIIVELTIDRQDRSRSTELFEAMRRRGYTAARIQGLYAMPFGKRHDLANWHFRRATAVS